VAATTSPTAISENELHTLLWIVNGPERDHDRAGQRWLPFYGLRELIPCDVIAFDGPKARDRAHFLGHVGPYGDGEPPDTQQLFWAHVWHSGRLQPERTGDPGSVRMTTDLGTLRQVDQVSMRGHDPAMRVFTPDAPDRSLHLTYYRGTGNPDYTERDWALLTLLRPYLNATHLEVLQRRHGVPDLTPRQWELLRLVDAGYGNRQIARELNVTENTVRKHLENIFERLAVTSRTAAVARAFPERALIGSP
jgi:DNA-binding CsgD family transcriptional regulator